MKKRHKKKILIEYQPTDVESEGVLGRVFEKAFSRLIQRQKYLRNYIKTDKYKDLYTYLVLTKSPMVNFLSPIDKAK